MKKSLICKLLIVGICIAWSVRYVTLNHGHILSYPYHMHDIEYYNIGDNIEFGSNSMYSAKNGMNGFSITVNSSKTVDFNDFCLRYNKKADDFTIPCDRYIEVNITISNLSGKDTLFPFLPLVLKCTDWYSEYLNEETGFANDDLNFYREYGRITGIDIQNKETVDINLVYGVRSEMFTNERWLNFDKENIYLVLTTFPIEKRIGL